MTAEQRPSFRNPPVVETALSVQFENLRAFRTTHFGQFYTLVRERFPITEDKPRLEPVTESFPPLPRMPVLRIAPDSGGPGRVWFRDSAGCTLLQVQPDRFGFNWCRNGDVEYPRYASNQPRMFDEFDRFRAFCRTEGLGEVRPNLCEVTYVNHIRPVGEQSAAEYFAEVFSGIDWRSADDWLPQPPDVVLLNRVYTIGEHKGRLYAEAGVATDQAGDFITLKITARVIHENDDDLRDNLDLAHVWVVRSFVSLTRDNIRQESWGQQV